MESEARRVAAMDDTVSKRQASFESRTSAAATLSPTNSLESLNKEQINPSNFLTMIENFYSAASGRLDDLHKRIQENDDSQRLVVEWMGEKTDAPELLRSILRFCRDFDTTFARVHKLIAPHGIKEYEEAIRESFTDQQQQH